MPERTIRSRTSAWHSWSGLVAALLIVGQFVWRGAYLWPGYYSQDDYRLLRLGSENDLTWSFLMQEYAGHIWPGNFLVAWMAAHVAPNSWVLTATAVLLVQAASAVVLWAVLTRVLGADWRRIPVLVFYLACPLTLWATQWWASAIGFGPLCFFMLVAVWGLLRRIQDGWRAGSVVVVLALVGGLAFQERAVLISVLLGGVGILLAEGGPIRRVREALRATPVLWGVLVAVLAGYLVLHARLAPITFSEGSQSEGGGLALFRDYTLRNVLPGLGGGPVSVVRGSEQTSLGEAATLAAGYLEPTVFASILGCVVTAAVVAVVALRTDLTGRLALLLVALYTVADFALLFGGRTQFIGTLGLVPRYAADVVPVAALGLAFALRGIRPGPRRLLPVAITLGYLALCVVSTSVIAPIQRDAHDRGRDYVATLREELRSHPDASVYDRPARDDVMINWFEEDGRLSTVLAMAPEAPVFDVPSSQLVTANREGELEPVRLTLIEDLSPDTDDPCGYRLDQGRRARDLALPDDARTDRWVLVVDYFSGRGGLISLLADDRPYDVRVRPGTHSAFFVLDGDADRLRLTWTRGGTTCVTGARLGFPSQVLE